MVPIKRIYIGLLKVMLVLLTMVGHAGVRHIVETALKKAIRQHRLEGLRRSLGSTNLDVTPDELFTLRNQS